MIWLFQAWVAGSTPCSAVVCRRQGSEALKGDKPPQTREKLDWDDLMKRFANFVSSRTETLPGLKLPEDPQKMDPGIEMKPDPKSPDPRKMDPGIEWRESGPSTRPQFTPVSESAQATSAETPSDGPSGGADPTSADAASAEPVEEAAEAGSQEAEDAPAEAESAEAPEEPVEA